MIRGASASERAHPHSAFLYSLGPRLPGERVDLGPKVWEYPILKSATLDDRRRLVMPPECPPGSAVTIQALDEATWLVKRQLPAKDYKMVAIPVIERLADDPDWEKVEHAFTQCAAKTVSEPEE